MDVSREIHIPVSVVVPMYNAGRRIARVLDAVISQDYDGPVEVIVVDDGSTDGSSEIVRAYHERGDVTLISQPNRGAVEATNNGFKRASHDIICSVDSDVVLHSDWLRKVVSEFDDPKVGAVQGYYKTPEGVSFWARMMGYDVETRYDSIDSKYVTQVCTGDTAYRREAVEKVGLFDPAFTYGYDNDMSYRLLDAGYRLVFRKDALCDHYWKEDLRGYIKQQYNSAYGRMQLVSKHRKRVSGDSVSGLRMMVQVPATLAFFVLLSAGLLTGAGPVTGASFIVLGAIVVDRLEFSYRVYKKQKDLSAFALPLVHILRNLVWSFAFLKWTVDRWRKGPEGS